MRILVDHLTRMGHGYFCVAGIDESGNHVRPVLNHGRLPVSLLAQNGGVFELGATIDIGPTTHVGAAPEFEDHEFDPVNAQLVSGPDPDVLWSRLVDNAELSLGDIFGEDLRPQRPGAVVPVGAGKASLGTLEPGYRPKLLVRDGRPRCKITDPDLGELDLSITDARFYKLDEDQWWFSEPILDENSAACEGETPVLLSVGLGRPWPATDPAHWLQVNGVYFEPTTTPTGPAYDVKKIREEYPNAYQPWTEEDEQLLTLLHKRGLSVREMGEILGRQDGGITSRLSRLGLID